jgi:hypothetical protein
MGSPDDLFKTARWRPGWRTRQENAAQAVFGQSFLKPIAFELDSATGF